MKRPTILIVCCLFLSLSLIGQTDTISTDKTYDYQTQLEEQFKKENLWYRIWNRYELHPGFSEYSLGWSDATPSNGWDNIDNKWGLKYRRRHLEIGYNSWKGTTPELDSASRYNRFTIGYQTPSGLFSIGKRYLDVKGFLIKPIIAAGYSNTNKSHGVYVSPGLHLQLPFAIISARANADYNFKDGFNVFPEISVQLDALRTLMDPQLKRTGTFHSTSTTATPLGGGWYSVRTRHSASAFEIEDIGPFWGVTPRIGYAPAIELANPYMSYGLGITGRINYFGADIRYDKTKLRTGVVSNVNALDATVRNEFDNEKVKGLVDVSSLTFEANVNLVGLFLGIVKKNAVSKMGNTTTPLNRLSFHLGYTKLNPGKVTFENPDSAATYTNQFFANHPEIERNSINDPLQIEKEWGVSYGLSLELGAVGVRVNNMLGKSIGRGSTIDLYYMLPLTKIFKAYKPFKE